MIIDVILAVIFLLMGITRRKQNAQHWKLFLAAGVVLSVGAIASMILRSVLK